jgi:hypothetical protein
MRSILDEGVKRGELSDDSPVEELALFINAQLYGLMVAWCMTDGIMIGSEQADSFCETIVKQALEPYKIKGG